MIKPRQLPALLHFCCPGNYEMKKNPGTDKSFLSGVYFIPFLGGFFIPSWQFPVWYFFLHSFLDSSSFLPSNFFIPCLLFFHSLHGTFSFLPSNFFHSMPGTFSFLAIFCWQANGDMMWQETSCVYCTPTLLSPSLNMLSCDNFTMLRSHLLPVWPIPTIPTFICQLPIWTLTSVDLDEYSV